MIFNDYLYNSFVCLQIQILALDDLLRFRTYQ